MAFLDVEEADKQADKLLREMYPDQFDEDDKDKDGEGADKGDDLGDDKKSDDGPGDHEGAGDDGSGSGDGDSDKSHLDDGDQGKKVDDWEQKYKVLKGKYDKEVPELHRSMKEMKEEILQVKDSLSTKKKVDKTDINDGKTSDDPDITYLAEEFPDIHRAVAKMLADAKNPKVEERLQRVEVTAVEAAKERFFKDLGEAVPDWQTIRDDERFSEWLNEIDELTDAPRFQLAVLAQNNLNGKQLAKFYNRFKKEVIGNGDGTDTSGKTEKDLAKHTGMPRSRSGKAPDSKSGDNDIVTRDDIRKFYKDAAAGKFVGDDEAFKRIETKIHKAMQEGRIT